MAVTHGGDIRIKTPTLTLAARAWGPVGGRPVLALHGWLDNASSFQALAPLLGGCRVVALDLVGHGRSDWRPPGVHYHLVDYVGDVLAAADALGWEQFHLLGHSLGAGIASLLAGAAPQRVDKLALIEGLGPLTHSPETNPRALAMAVQQMRALPDKRLPLYPSVEEAAATRQRVGDLSPEAALILALRGVKECPGGVTWRTDPRLTFRSPLYLTEAQVLAFLTRIRAPTLLINGRDGYLVQRPPMQTRYDRVKHLDLRWLEGKHHLHMDHPGAVGKVLTEFFWRGDD